MEREQEREKKQERERERNAEKLKELQRQMERHAELEWRQKVEREMCERVCRRLVAANFITTLLVHPFKFFVLSLPFSKAQRMAYSIMRSGLFDIGWYLERYPDVAEAGIDPVVHYVRFGAKEGRDPAPWFSTSAYLQANPDVQKKRLNPFYHYIRFGFNEGRKLC